METTYLWVSDLQILERLIVTEVCECASMEMLSVFKLVHGERFFSLLLRA